MKLRDYQQRGVEKTLELWNASRRRVLVTLPTGCGKTVVMAEIIRRRLQDTGLRAMLIAHRQELIFQAADKIQKVAGVTCDIEMADRRADDGMFGRSPVICASKDTLQGARLERFDPSEFGCFLIDEAHHAIAQTYQAPILHFLRHERCGLLGVTATPDRADEIALGNVFEDVAIDYQMRQAIEDGWLVRVRVKSIDVRSIDISTVSTTAGDLSESQLAGAINRDEAVLAMVEPMLETAGDRRTLVFAVTVAHANHIAEVINHRKPGMATVVHGGTPADERAAKFRDFGNGRTQYLVNVGIATEGWDDPATDGKGVQYIALMRPTKSRSLYAQMIGRGTRPLPGVVDGQDLDTPEKRQASIAASAKPCVTILDFQMNAGRHVLAHAADVLGGREAESVEESVLVEVKESSEAGGEFDVLEAIREVETRRDLEAERRQAERDRMKVRVDFATEEVDPFAAAGIQRPNMHFGWAAKPASESKIVLLESYGFQNVRNVTEAEATALFAAHARKQQASGPQSASEAQVRYLRKLGFKGDASKLTKEQASGIIGRLKGQAVRA